MNSPIIPEDFDVSQRGEIDQLEKSAQRRLLGRVRDFRLLVRPEGLVLQGSAATFHAKQLAQHAIMDATRLPILTNEIKVDAFCCES